MNASRRSVLIIAITGIVSSLLPWETQTRFTPHVSSKSLFGFEGDALGMVILCVIAIIVAITGKRKARLSAIKRWIIFSTGILILVYCGWLLYAIRDNNMFAARINIDLIEMPAIGLWVGGFIGLLLCVLPFVVKGKQV
jgi:hypothetical protein